MVLLSLQARIARLHRPETAKPHVGDQQMMCRVLMKYHGWALKLAREKMDPTQEVVIERFPYKKCFNVDQTHFVVGAEEVVTLTLTWTPQEAGSCREMVLFHVNDVYRLQAYVFGTADDLKPVKKGVSRLTHWSCHHVDAFNSGSVV